ncbi:MAG: DNA polymerase III subunit gamma/tau [Elusimicrobia bacterium]|nr:MAG: DNA polymerase III subunit gamma/tau [Elusimicrobiota bacterium]
MSDTPYVGFARKYRPQRFDDVVGQEAASTTLANAISSGQVGHAYLFFGPRGVGKTTSARLLAKSINCKTGPIVKSCGKCHSCKEIASSTSIDVFELDAASNTQVDKIREVIIETVHLAPSRDRYKIFIIDEVHMLSTSSFNALLKTLEEPPSHVVFILATTELQKIPATIVSRCQRFRFRPIPRDVTANYLKKIAKAEKVKTEDSALAMIAKASGGAMRDAVSLLDQANAFLGGNVTLEGVGELMGTLPIELQRGLIEAILAKDAKSLSTWVEKATQEGFDPTQLLRDLRERLQELHLHKLGVDGGLDDTWSELADPHSSETFNFLLGRVNKTLEEMRGTDSPQIAFELGIYGMLESAYDLRGLVARLETLERRLASGAVAPSPAAAEVLPAKSPAQGLGPAVNVWPAVLKRLEEEKPALVAGLEGVRLLPSDAGPWHLVFAQSFNMDRAKAHQALIEKALGDVSGRKVALSFEVDETLGVSGKKSSSNSGGWSDASEEDGAAEDPGVKKVLGVLGGNIRRVKKKK